MYSYVNVSKESSFFPKFCLSPAPPLNELQTARRTQLSFHILIFKDNIDNTKYTQLKVLTE